MPKLQILYKDQLNFLNRAGTIEMLIAISYFRGSRGEYADPARNFIENGIRDFLEGLSDKDKKVFNEIRESVRIARSK